MKAAQLKLITVILKGVPPLSSFLYLIYLVDVVSVPLTEGNNHIFSRGSPLVFYPPGPLHNQIQILFVLQKNQALPEGGQRLNYKNDTDQD